MVFIVDSFCNMFFRWTSLFIALRPCQNPDTKGEGYMFLIEPIESVFDNFFHDFCKAGKKCSGSLLDFRIGINIVCLQELGRAIMFHIKTDASY